MISIGKQNYYFHGDIFKAEIALYQPKTKTKITIRNFEYHNDPSYYGMDIATRHDNYIVIDDYQGFCGIFDGDLVKIDYSHRDFCIDNFTYVKDKYLIFKINHGIPRVSVNEIKTGRNIITKIIPFDKYGIKQSFDGEHVIFWKEEDEQQYYIIPSKVFINSLLIDENISILDKYKIQSDESIHWQWATYNIIYGLRPCGYNDHDESIWHFWIYNIDNKHTIYIDNVINHPHTLFFINTQFYIFLETEIMIIDENATSDNGIKKIPNEHKLIHYNPTLDVFINSDFEFYKQIDVNYFARFQFTGDYQQDYIVVPKHIQVIINCLLYFDIIYDIVNEIYYQLLKIDSHTNLFY